MFFYKKNTIFAPKLRFFIKMTQNQPQQSPFQPIHTGGFNTEPAEGWTSFSVKGTTSFAAIHSEVSVNVVYSSTQPVGTRRNAGRPGGNIPTDDPTGWVPVGDMLLPLLVITACYIIIKLFRNRKISKAL